MAAWPYNTAAWQKLRRAKLSSQPLCEVCIRREIVEPADTVDHIVAIEKGGEPFPPLEGLMSMCAACHNIKTNAVDHPAASGFRRALKGFDVDGNPLDDDDDWHTAAHSGPHSAVGVNRAETPAKAQRAPAATHGPPVAPGGFEGRESTGAGPAGDTRIDLLSCESFATRNQEA